MRRTLIAIGLCALCAGCADLRNYAPRENLNGSGPRGYPAAVYPFATADGTTRGEVRLWSQGARGEPAKRAAGRRVEVHVGFELENTGETPLELSAIRAEGDQLSLVRMEGESLAAPGATAALQAWFLAPEARSTRDVDGFTIHFTVMTGEAAIFTQATPFSAWRPAAAYHYDPWFFGPHWGVGLGLGWHWHCH